MPKFSKTQIDKLGERLRDGDPTDDDLRMLDEYRRAFGAVYDAVLKRLQQGVVDGEISGRAAKTTTSIVQKLRRQQTRHVRLSQIQDVCGLRVVVPNVAAQNQVAEWLKEVFPESAVDDRRKHPSHGYRAVHVIATLFDLHAEIQVRTTFQHMWAQFCENLADKLGIEVKYGGHEAAQKLLATLSDAIRNLEEAEGTDLIRETPYSNPMLRTDFMQAFRGLIHFVAEGTRAHQTNSLEATDVRPH